MDTLYFFFRSIIKDTAPQERQENCALRYRAILMRSVAMERGLCRSPRTRTARPELGKRIEDWWSKMTGPRCRGGESSTGKLRLLWPAGTDVSNNSGGVLAISFELGRGVAGQMLGPQVVECLCAAAGCRSP